MTRIFEHKMDKYVLADVIRKECKDAVRDFHDPETLYVAGSIDLGRIAEAILHYHCRVLKGEKS